MPELSRFLGIVIELRFDDVGQHNKPHVHVKYAEHRAVFGLDGDLLSGSFPNKQTKLLQAWFVLHEEELYAAWNKAVKNEHFDKIKPLQ
jgi:hypothetical protein